MLRKRINVRGGDAGDATSGNAPAATVVAPKAATAEVKAAEPAKSSKFRDAVFPIYGDEVKKFSAVAV